jgi:hypothetical protein
MAAMVMLTVLACRPLDYGVLVGKNSRRPATTTGVAQVSRRGVGDSGYPTFFFLVFLRKSFANTFEKNFKKRTLSSTS